jgi:hypothetical protein
MQKVRSAEDQRADGRARSFRGLPREEANQTSSVLQEEMMSPSSPGTIGSEFTKIQRGSCHGAEPKASRQATLRRVRFPRCEQSSPRMTLPFLIF